MAYKVAGGTKWWQVRAGPGVEAEWIVTKKDWKEAKREERIRAKDGMVGADGGMGDNGECKYAGGVDTQQAYAFITLCNLDWLG